MSVHVCVWSGSRRLAMDTYRPHAVLIVLLLSSDSCMPSQFPTQLMIKEWVDQIQLELVTLADTASAGKSLSQIFLDNQNLYTVESNDAEELVARAARNIEQLLLKRAAALEVRHRVSMLLMYPQQQRLDD